MFIRLRLAVASVAILAVAQAATAQKARYDGHRVVRVELKTEDQLKLLLSMTDDVWSERTGVGPLDVRVSPEQFDRLRASGLPFDVMIANVQAKIDAEAAELEAPGPRGPWAAYMDNDSVNAYLINLETVRPDLAQVIDVGTTVQGRTIKGLRITGPGTATKPGIIYHGCEHAREWITVPVALYVADQLVSSYDTNPYIHELVDRCEWFIIPVFNVDGYIRTWGPDRLWRKNLRDNDSNGTINSSDGVDINRNWGYQWGGEGASTIQSDQTYRGPSPFSEPETRAMRDFILAHPNIITHNDIHSYSQLILWPWGYQSPTSIDEPIFNYIGTTMRALILAVHGMSYTPGAIYNNIYPASGVSVDWTYGARNILGFSFELRDTGTNGFLLPATQILPNCQEIFPALMFQADYATQVRPALKIEYPNGLPVVFAPNVDNTLPVRIAAGWDTPGLVSPTLHVRTSNGGPFTEYPLTLIAGNEYLATFPARGCGDPTGFYIRASGALGSEVRSPAAAPTNSHSVAIGTATPAFSDNFETNQGWTVTNISVTGGAWVRVDPVGTFSGGNPVQPEDDNPAGTGTMCYVTGNGAPGGTAGGSDLDGGPTRLTSPMLDLSGLTSPALSYYRWFYCSTGEDTLVVEISNDNGVSWVTLETVTHDPAWRQRTFRVEDFITPTNQVRLRFSASDNPNNSITDAAVDDVVVSSVSCVVVPTSGDLNCDSTVDVLDAPPFVLALTDPDGYAAAHPTCNISRGDMNLDSLVNGDDIEPFVALIAGP